MLTILLKPSSEYNGLPTPSYSINSSESGSALFDPASSNEKVMVMFTDGVTTAGGNPNTVASLAKSQGVILYCIGLSGNGGLDVQALNSWASDPDSAYVAITPR